VTALDVAVPLLGAAAKKTTGSNPTIFILLIIGVGFYFLIYRPQQRKAKAVRQQGKTFEVGDEVLTAGGIVGYVIDIDDDRVTLETSVGASFVVLKQYVLRTLEQPVPAEPDDETDYEDSDYGDLGGQEDETESATDEGEEVQAPDGEVAGSDAGEDAAVDDPPSSNGDNPPGRRRSKRRSSKDSSHEDGGPAGPPGS
jgi:preprotein translocase subunit YajC